MIKKSAIIIGGGVIGAFTAYQLLNKGWQVTIVDKGRFGEGCSEGNCGLIVPNHILPLNASGTLFKTIRGMLLKDAPLYVKPRIDLNLFNWFYRFSRNCGQRNVLASARGRHALLQSSFGLYPSIVEKEQLDCNWEVGGSLHVFRTAKEWRAYGAVDAVLRKFGIAAEKLNRDRLLHLEPGLSPDLVGGWHYNQTAHLWPERLLEALRRLLTKKGANIIEDAEATGFETRNGHAEGVRAGGKIIAGHAFVVAAGAWTPQLQQELGCRIPIQPGKGYALTTTRPLAAPSRPCFFEEKSVVATPWTDGFRLGGTMEFSGFDDSLNPKRLKALSNGAAQYMPGITAGAVEKEWCGFRPMTYDGLPIIDQSPRLKNVTIAAGHNMMGISMGPGTGKLVAEMINRETPHIDPRPYSLERFSRTGFEKTST